LGGIGAAPISGRGEVRIRVRGGPDARRGHEVFAVSVSELKLHWLVVLDVTARAIADAAAARCVDADVERACLRRVRAERAWLETVDWPSTHP
jgi:hypothetical protein